MMTLEYLAEQKAKYQNKMNYFQNIGFENLATEFQEVVDLIGQIEDCLKQYTVQND